MDIPDQKILISDAIEQQLKVVQNMEDLLIKHKAGATFKGAGYTKFFQDFLTETEKYNEMTKNYKKWAAPPPKLTSEYSQQINK